MRIPAARLQTLGLMMVAMTAVTFGDILLAQAMRSVGEVSFDSLSKALALGKQVFTTPKVWLALLLMATFFFIWMTVLSWEDLSFVLPLTALTYLLNAVLVGPFLGETVTPLRWAGTILIGLGVVLVTLSGEESAASAQDSPGVEPAEPLQVG